MDHFEKLGVVAQVLDDQLWHGKEVPREPFAVW
jgi:hypothetical protein